MNIDLRGVFTGKIKNLPVKAELDFSSLEIGGSNPISSKVLVNGSISNSAEVVTFDCKASFIYKAPCDRCAVLTEKALEIPINHIIVNSLGNDDEEDFIVSENMELDLDDLIRSDIILGLPYLFLCKDDCKGVCPECGKNLNTENCSCKGEVDERWAKLSEFFE